MAASRNLFPNALELAQHRSVVDCAAHADDGAAENGGIARIARANLLTRQPLDLRLQSSLLGVTEIARRRDLCFRKSHTRVEFVTQLLNDRVEEMHPAVIDQ